MKGIIEVPLFNTFPQSGCWYADTQNPGYIPTTAYQITPCKVFMTMGWDGKVYGNYAYYKPGENTLGFSDVTNYLKQGGLTNNDLLSGYDLIQVLQHLVTELTH